MSYLTYKMFNIYFSIHCETQLTLKISPIFLSSVSRPSIFYGYAPLKRKLFHPLASPLESINGTFRLNTLVKKTFYKMSRFDHRLWYHCWIMRGLRIITLAIKQSHKWIWHYILIQILKALDLWILSLTKY
jgi:hypothetical protein